MRKKYSSEFKSKLVLKVLHGNRMLNEIAFDNEIQPNMLTRWKTEGTINLLLLFENENSKIRKQSKDYEHRINELHRQIGELTAQYVWIKKIWLYLVAIINWYSKYVPAWELDDTLDIPFVLDTCKKALGSTCPTIMNSVQGSHFTSSKCTVLFLEVGAKISMDHRGRAYNNIFIERFWRSLKYEDIYLRDYQYPREARKWIHHYMEYLTTNGFIGTLTTGHQQAFIMGGTTSFPSIILHQNNQCIKGS